MSRLEIELPDLAATACLGAAIAPHLRAGDLLLLEGELGAGKTTLARAIGEGLRADPPLASPTFVLASEHAGRLPIWHLDAYRLEAGGDPVALGLIDTRNERGVTIVEWGERLSFGSGTATMQIDLEEFDQGRRATMIDTDSARLDQIAVTLRAAGLHVGPR